MVKVITYGTYDLLHHGHIRLLERAKALGDYLIVGVTSDDFDKVRGKINVQQSLIERIEAVKQTGIADEIIVEEYPGQKIDDIVNLGIDIFTVGSDWAGHFDYLNEYCKVIYLDRTKGVSSSEERAKKRSVRIGMYGDSGLNEFVKYKNECVYVNGAEIVGICNEKDIIVGSNENEKQIQEYSEYEELLDNCDAVYLETEPKHRYEQIKKAISKGRHVLCKTPIALKEDEAKELFDLAEKKGVVLMGAIKTAYATAYKRLILLAKSGFIGRIVHIDVACTRIEDKNNGGFSYWDSMCTWAPFGLLPVFQLFGTDYKKISYISCMMDEKSDIDAYTKIDLLYDDKAATVTVGKGIKLEGELIIAGRKGYIYVPAPWWKTDYFEIRYEDQEAKKRYFYQLDGEGIRFEIADFVKKIRDDIKGNYPGNDILEGMSGVVEKYYAGENVVFLKPLGYGTEN